jgi:hydroxymethylbilane synthase
MTEGQYGGVLLAAAGLARLGISHPHRIDLDPAQFPPAPGQGALAAQTREKGPERDLAAVIDHAPTRAAVVAERAFLKGCGGGCHAALGALATVRDGVLTLRGELFVSVEGGARAHGGEISGPAPDAERLGHDLARRVLSAVRG